MSQLRFSAEEQEAINHINQAMQIIQGWELKGNHEELGQAVHSMQMFVVSHAMTRIGFQGISSWYA